MKKRIKLHGFIIFLAVSAIVAFPGVFLRNTSPGLTEEILSVLGIACVLMGQIIRLSSRGFKSEQSRNGFALVQGGPYSLVRNPMYLGIILIGSGLVMMLFRWWAICVFLAAFSFIYIRLIFQEEKKLEAMFKESFVSYRKITPAMIPSPATVFKTEISSYLPLRSAWVRRELGSICGVLIFALIIKSWENISGAGSAIAALRLFILVLMMILAAALAAYLIRKTNAFEKSL